MELGDHKRRKVTDFSGKFSLCPNRAKCAQIGLKMNLLKGISKLDHYFSLIFCLTLEVNDLIKMAQQAILEKIRFIPKWAIARYPTCAQNGPFERYLEIGSLDFFDFLSEVRGQ